MAQGIKRVYHMNWQYSHFDTQCEAKLLISLNKYLFSDVFFLFFVFAGREPNPHHAFVVFTVFLVKIRFVFVVLQ